MTTTFQNANFIGTVKIRGDLDINGPTTETIFGGTIRCNSLYIAGDEISTVYAKLEMPTFTGLNVVGQTVGDPVIKIYPNYTGAHQSSFICINNTGVSDGSPNQLILGSVSTSVPTSIFSGYAKIDTASNGVSSSTPLSIRCQGTEHIRLEPVIATTPFRTTISSNLYAKDIFINDACSLYAGLGINCKPGMNGAYSNNVFNANWEESALQMYIGTNKIATLATTCDYRLKDNIENPKSVLDRLCSIPMFTYNYKNISIFRDNGKHIGYFAHELQEAFPELINIVTGKKDDVDASGNMVIQTINSEFTHLLMKAIQEQNEIVLNLQKRVENLESCLHNSNN